MGLRTVELHKRHWILHEIVNLWMMGGGDGNGLGNRIVPLSRIGDAFRVVARRVNANPSHSLIIIPTTTTLTIRLINNDGSSIGILAFNF